MLFLLLNVNVDLQIQTVAQIGCFDPSSLRWEEQPKKSLNRNHKKLLY